MEVDNFEEWKKLERTNIEFRKKCSNLAAEINAGQSTILHLIEQLGVLLVDKVPENRELGTWILTQVLTELINLDGKQLQVLCSFYIDRIKDHNQVIPAVLSGILSLIQFDQFPLEFTNQILTSIFQNVACQQQPEQDRLTIYKIFNTLLEKSSTEINQIGFDYVYGVISAIDSERNPNNLLYIFNWFPKFVKTVTLGHLMEEAFECLACYFPVDFKPTKTDENSITRQQLADALAVCLTSIPQFAEFCFTLALEKLDSSLEIAKLDSLKLLELGCLTFDSSAYMQHATEMWSQLQKEIFFNTHSEMIETASFQTLKAVIKKISEDANVSIILKDITDTLKGNLLPDMKLFEASANILLNVAAASAISSKLITNEIAPILINSFNITTNAMHRIKLLKKLIDLFDSYVNFYSFIDSEELSKVPVLSLKASIDQDKILQITGFESLTKIAKSLPIDLRFSLYNNIATLLNSPMDADVKSAVLLCFKTLAFYYPSEVNERLLSSNNNFEALCVIVDQDFFTEIVLTRIVNSLDDFNGENALNALRKISDVENEDVFAVFCDLNVFGKVLDWYLGQNLALDCSKCIAVVLKNIMRKQNSGKQREVLARELPKVDSRSVYALSGLLCCLKRDVDIDYTILNDLTNLILPEDVNVDRSKLIANLLNKCSDENVISNYLDRFSDSFDNYSLIGWITKALVMRNHVKAYEWTDKLICGLEKDISVASFFDIILDENIDELSEKSYCTKAVLYQQKFFTIVSKKFLENYNTCGEVCYLVAFGHLLKNTPKNIILLLGKKILKLIISILDLNDDILLIVLPIIVKFIEEKEQIIEDHLSDFISRFLTISTSSNSMNVRVLALKCLQECTYSFPVYKLLMHKQDVLITLGKVIDDKKRLVRREAVEARSLWFLIDAPM